MGINQTPAGGVDLQDVIGFWKTNHKTICMGGINHSSCLKKFVTGVIDTLDIPQKFDRFSGKPITTLLWDCLPRLD